MKENNIISINPTDFKILLNAISTIAKIAGKTDIQKDNYDFNSVKIVKKEISDMIKKYDLE